MDRRKGESPCEDDINQGLVDGQEEGRIGLHVESEVVLKCERNNNESARHAVLVVKSDCFARDTVNLVSMTQVLGPREKITCAGVRRTRGLSVVFTLPVACKGIVLVCKRNPLSVEKR